MKKHVCRVLYTFSPVFNIYLLVDVCYCVFFFCHQLIIVVLWETVGQFVECLSACGDKIKKNCVCVRACVSACVWEKEWVNKEQFCCGVSSSLPPPPYFLCALLMPNCVEVLTWFAFPDWSPIDVWRYMLSLDCRGCCSRRAREFCVGQEEKNTTVYILLP